MKTQTQLSPHAYRSGEGFIGHYQKLLRETVIPYQYQVFMDAVPGVAKSHTIANFVNAGKLLRGEDPGDGYYGMVFQDSDLAKWLEAAAYSLISYPDPALEQQLDDLIDVIASAQMKDGYLNSYFTLNAATERWTNLQEAHELYCNGHMMEAACAYYDATGKDKLLRVMQRVAWHIYDVFVTGGHEGYPGHQEIELALMQMYRITGDEKCRELALHFLNVRGQDPDFLDREAASRKIHIWETQAKAAAYLQAHKPVREQEDAVGHAVRSCYMYAGMADAAAATDDESMLAACRRLWQSITRKRMYVTGGIGSTYHNEGYTVDYDLPGDTAYCETCASIALIFFASRMLETELNGEYADVMERALYNTVLAGMQQDGKRFFYVNPLEVVPGVSGEATTHRHALPERPGWYGCACCPPNVARLISSVGRYAYGENDTTAFIHLFVDGEVSFRNGLKMTCRTGYPFVLSAEYTVTGGAGEAAVRIPAWSRSFTLLHNGKAVSAAPVNGYVSLSAKAGDVIDLKLDDTPYQVYANPRVHQLTGKVVLCRGPLVYCFEGVDNDGDVLGLSLVRGGKVSVETAEVILPGVPVLKAQAMRSQATDDLYVAEPLAQSPCTATAIPYFLWANRGLNQMRVWMNEIIEVSK